MSSVLGLCLRFIESRNKQISLLRKWITRESGEFKITNTQELSILWVKCKNSKNTMNHGKILRTMAYHIDLSNFNKLQFKLLTQSLKIKGFISS